MARNQAQVRAAEFYAKEHGLSTHQAFEDKTFQRMWNDFLGHPNNPTMRKSLGLNGRKLRKEGEAEEKTFCEPAEIRRYTVTGDIQMGYLIKENTVLSLTDINMLLHDLSQISGQPYVWLEYDSATPGQLGVKLVSLRNVDLPDTSIKLEDGVGASIAPHLSAILGDEDRTAKFYELVRHSPVSKVPMFVKLQFESLDIELYTFVMIPDDLRNYGRPVDWQVYVKDHIHYRIRHAERNPTGLYLRWAGALFDYAQLWSNLLTDPESVVKLDTSMYDDVTASLLKLDD